MSDTGGPLSLQQLNELINATYPDAQRLGGSQFRPGGGNDGYITYYGRDPIDVSERLKTVYNPITEGTQYYLDGIPVTGVNDGSGGALTSWHSQLENQPLTADQQQAALGYGPQYLQGATYIPDWNARLKEADNGGGIIEALSGAALGMMLGGVAGFGPMAGSGVGSSGGSLGDLMSGLGDTTADIAAGAGMESGGWGALTPEQLSQVTIDGGGNVFNSGTGGGAVPMDQLFGVANTGQMSSSGVLESVTGNPVWDASFGQTVGEGASLAGGAAASGLSMTDLKSVLDTLKTGKSAVSALSSALGGGIAVPAGRTATQNTSTSFGTPGKSILEIMMGAEDDNGLDAFMQLMAQSGKGA